MKVRKNGFTLIELTLSIGILCFLSIIVYKLVSSANKTAAIARCRGHLRQNAQIVGKYLEKDISSSRAILDENDSSNRMKTTINPVNPTGPLIVTMQCPKNAIENQNARFFDSSLSSEAQLYETVKYTVSDGVLKRNNMVIGDKIKSISFATNSADNIDTTYDGKTEITIVAAGNPDGQAEIIEYEERIIVSIRQLQNKLLKDRDVTNNKRWQQRINANDY